MKYNSSLEYFEEVSIIHINGRLYDPLLRRFLNADENIQDPTNTQNYNKYGYVMNNPLMFNDPSGEIFVAGFFLTWIAPVIWGAIMGTAIAGTAYLLTAAFTQNFTWKGFGMALLGGAVGGGITGFLNPGLFLTGGYSFLGQYASGVISSIMPAWNVNIGNFSFGLSPSIAFGKGVGFGANVSASFTAGDIAISAGFGLMNYGANAASGESGWEFRKSIMAGTLGKKGNLGLMLGTNIWSGMYEQQTGIIRLASGDFSISYENDGKPFSGTVGDGGDSYRTAAASIGIGDFSVGVNLFTGLRDKDSYENFENNGRWDGVKGEIGPSTTKNGITYKNGLVYEKGSQYRLGAAYIGYKNYRFGINSDRVVRHTIQNRLIHNSNFAGQRAFEVVDFSTKPYLQYQTKNMFTTW